MKKFFNDHVALFFILALCVAAAALAFSLKNRKDLKVIGSNLSDYIRNAAELTPGATTQTTTPSAPASGEGSGSVHE